MVAVGCVPSNEVNALVIVTRILDIPGYGRIVSPLLRRLIIASVKDNWCAVVSVPSLKLNALVNVCCVGNDKVSVSKYV
jgi:hypothetical protein